LFRVTYVRFNIFMNEDLSVPAGGRASRLHYGANRAGDKAITAQPSEPVVLFIPPPFPY